MIVPVYREGEAARGTIEALAVRAPTPNEILVVYDEPDDPTREVVEDIRRRFPAVRPVHNAAGRGPALALRTGFDVGRGDVVVVVMADASDDLDDLPRMLKKIEEGFDLVAGSRYMPGGRQLGGPRLKGWLSRMAGLSLHHLAGLPTRDATSAFKMYRKAMLEGLPLESDAGFEISLEITVKAFLSGHRIAELPTIWRDRTEGTSRFRLIRWLPRYFRWYWLGLRGGTLLGRVRALRPKI